MLIFAQDSGTHQKQKDTNIHQTRSDTIIRKKQFDSGTKNRPVISSDSTVTKDTVVKKKVIKALQKKDSAAIALANSNFSDSLRRDSLQKDSVRLAHVAAAAVKKDSIKIKLMPGVVKSTSNVDVIFYVLVFILFFLGLIKTAFPKYFESIFSLSFQAAFRQTQTRDTMSQNFFPAFMLNILFILCGGAFITLYAKSQNWTELSFWELFVYATVILLIIYLIKFLVISFTGWVFNAKEAAVEYTFVVFLINKLLGVLMIPLLFLIAYANYQTKNVAITIALCLVAFSVAVRYLVSLSRIRKNLSITAFHFFLYLCAVEIMPMLVIYKVLFQQTSIR